MWFGRVLAVSALMTGACSPTGLKVQGAGFGLVVVGGILAASGDGNFDTGFSTREVGVWTALSGLGVIAFGTLIGIVDASSDAPPKR